MWFFLPNHLNVSAAQNLEWSLSVDRLTGWDLLAHQVAVNIHKPVGHSGDPAGAAASHVAPSTFHRSEHMLHREIGAAGSLVKASESSDTEFSVNHVLRLEKHRINEQRTPKEPDTHHHHLNNLRS